MIKGDLLMLELNQEELYLIVDWWRASNRYNAMKNYKTDEIVQSEDKLIAKILLQIRPDDAK